MSILYMSAVWRLKLGSHTGKLVLLALADNCNDAGTCFPSRKYLAIKCDLTREAVRVQLRKLTIEGFISIEERKDTAGIVTSNLYTLNLPAGSLDGPGPRIGPPTNSVAPPPTALPPHLGHGVAPPLATAIPPPGPRDGPEPSCEPSCEPSLGSVARNAPPEPGGVRRGQRPPVRVLPPARKPKFERPTPAQGQAYAAEIKLSAAECEAFFDHFDANGWLVGGRTAMKDWRAAMRTWKRNAAKFGPRAPGRRDAIEEMKHAGLDRENYAKRFKPVIVTDEDKQEFARKLKEGKAGPRPQTPPEAGPNGANGGKAP